MTTLDDRISARMAERGWKHRVVPWSRLESLRVAIEGRFRAGLLDEKAMREYLSFIYEAPPAFTPESIIVVAVKALPGHVTFGYRGRQVTVVIPPTYVGFIRTILTVVEALDEWLKPEGFRAVRPRLPMKTLAVCSGLAEYGRNNICYVDGLGSYFELAVAVSDMPCDSDPWREPKALDRCASCGVCERRCPSGAISRERFLLHAERCLTLFTESEDDFPGWIDPAWHNSLIGCMKCQEACPENARLAGCFDDLADFTEAETDLLTAGTPIGKLSADTIEKLKIIDFADDNYILLKRNLAALLEPRRG
jgi:epoxyqueuosine reductase